MNYKEAVLIDRMSRNRKQLKLLIKIERNVKLTYLVLKIQKWVFISMIKLFQNQENNYVELHKVSRNNAHFEMAGKFKCQKEFYENMLGAIK